MQRNAAKRRRGRTWMYGMLIVLFACIFVFSVGKYLEGERAYRIGEDAYAALGIYVSIPADAPKNEKVRAEGMADQADAEDPTVWPDVDFEALRAVNADIVAWIYLEGTSVSYPVVQGENNDEYLGRLFDGRRNGAGSIFLDSKNAADFSDRHSILYGHHMKNGTMFSALDDYREQSFYDAHPVILLITPEQRYRIRVFSAYVAAADADAWQIDIAAEAYDAWLAKTRQQSCFVSDVQPTAVDRIVTLSTCSYEFNNARFVVVGVLEAA